MNFELPANRGNEVVEDTIKSGLETAVQHWRDILDSKAAFNPDQRAKELNLLYWPEWLATEVDIHMDRLAKDGNDWEAIESHISDAEIAFEAIMERFRDRVYEVGMDGLGDVSLTQVDGYLKEAKRVIRDYFRADKKQKYVPDFSNPRYRGVEVEGPGQEFVSSPEHPEQ